MEQKYVAFISYRHAQLDAAVAKQLHTAIEQFVIPKALRRGDKKLGKVFRDLEELPASSNLSDDIYRALDNSQYLIVICSRAMTQSPWVTREVLYFLEHHDQDNVFTVLVDGEPGEVFPKVLLQKTLPDGTRVDVEPLAMDVRAESQAGTLKKVRREINRLLAALIGCPYDALVQRQQKRQRRRLLVGAGVILSVALLFSAVMLVKNRQIDAKNAELEQTNRQLEEQKAQIQLRESELLTGKAQQFLDSGDLGLALPYALDALDGDRPYYAPAEQALIASLGIFDDYTDYLLVNKYITQTTPVVDFQISTDGKQLATIDPYGIVRCFDTVTEQQLWQAQTEADARIFVCGDLLLVQGIHNIAAVAFSNGALQWEQSAQYEGNTLDLQYSVLSGDRLMLLGSHSFENYNKEKYIFTILDTATGSQLQSLELTQGQSILSATKHPYIQFCQLGAADQKYFVGAWREDISSDQTVMRLFRVDMEAMTWQELDTIPVARYTAEDNLYTLDIYNNCAYLLQGNKETNGLVTARAYDLTTATRLWQTGLVLDNLVVSVTPESIHTTFTQAFMAFSVENHLFWLDRHTGQELLRNDIQQQTVLLEAMPEGIYRIGLESGQLGYVWINSMSQLSSQIPAKLSESAQMKLYSNGFLQIAVENGRVGSAVADGTGFAACITKSDDHCIAITRSVGASGYFPVTEVPYEEENDRLANTSFWQTADGKLIMGPISLNTEEAPYHRFVLLDPADPQHYRNLYAGSRYANAKDLFFTADGKYCLECYDGNITWYDTATGDATVLAEKENVELLSVANVVYTARRYITAGCQRTDGVTVAARLEEQGITLWLDGQQTYIPAPEGAVLQQQVGNGMRRGLWVGSNGCVIATNFTDPEAYAWDRFWVYDTLADSWQPLVLDQPLESCQIAMGQTTRRAILVYGQSDAAVYDLQTGSRENTFDLLVPRDAIEQMQLIMEDQYLLVQTKDKQAIIYDLQSGQMIYQRQLAYTKPLSAIADGNRLYISWQSGGVCLDTGSWQELTDIPDMCWYDTVSRQLVLHGYAADSFDDVLKLRKLPDTEELLQIARTLLQR